MKITYKQIMSFIPCYDPKEIGMPENYEAELKDFMLEYMAKVKELSDIVWVCCRRDFFNDRDLRLFGVWSALQVKQLMQDKRSLNCLEVSEKFAFDETTEEELAAEAAAWAAAWAAEAAAWAARAARAAEAAWAARVVSVAWAAEAAASAARVAETASAARVVSAAREAQIETLLKMIEKPNGEWFKEWKENI